MSLPDTLAVLASKFGLVALPVGAALGLVRAVEAVVGVVAEPALEDATPVGALKLVFVAGLRLGTVGEGRVLVGPVDAVGVAVAHVRQRDTLRSPECFVLLARELCLWVARSALCITEQAAIHRKMISCHIIEDMREG
jgi:hypothetical protein